MHPLSTAAAVAWCVCAAAGQLNASEATPTATAAFTPDDPAVITPLTDAPRGDPPPIPAAGAEDDSSLLVICIAIIAALLIISLFLFYFLHQVRKKADVLENGVHENELGNKDLRERINMRDSIEGQMKDLRRQLERAQESREEVVGVRQEIADMKKQHSDRRETTVMQKDQISSTVAALEQRIATLQEQNEGAHEALELLKQETEANAAVAAAAAAAAAAAPPAAPTALPDDGDKELEAIPACLDLTPYNSARQLSADTPTAPSPQQPQQQPSAPPAQAPPWWRRDAGSILPSKLAASGAAADPLLHSLIAPSQAAAAAASASLGSPQHQHRGAYHPPVLEQQRDYDAAATNPLTSLAGAAGASHVLSPAASCPPLPPAMHVFVQREPGLGASGFNSAGGGSSDGKWQAYKKKHISIVPDAAGVLWLVAAAPATSGQPAERTRLSDIHGAGESPDRNALNDLSMAMYVDTAAAGRQVFVAVNRADCQQWLAWFRAHLPSSAHGVGGAGGSPVGGGAAAGLHAGGGGFDVSSQLLLSTSTSGKMSRGSAGMRTGPYSGGATPLL